MNRRGRILWELAGRAVAFVFAAAAGSAIFWGIGGVMVLW